jgi:hypothetical protein
MTEEKKHSYYLRVEGVNLDNFVFDTNDLSTIRGGGLLMLEAPDRIAKQSYSKGIKLDTITSGASWGLFRFQAEDDAQASRVATKVREQLDKDEDYQHATFVTEVLPAEDDTYVATREKLTALSHWQQMCAPSIIYPEEVDEKNIPEFNTNGKTQKIHICQFDHVRPAAKTTTKGGDQRAASLSVYRRREYGKAKKKREWYENLTGLKDLPKFTHDLSELTTEDKTQDFGFLNQKMAVIYLDGNGFGSLQKRHCTDETAQKNFDRKIRKELQNGTLAKLLLNIKEDHEWYARITNDKGKEENKIRLETLLWGGDEVIWVVPAWKGWWMLGRFFKLVEENWEYPAKSKLTLSAGLVFCHHNAPIQRIVNLCKNLGDLAKGDRSANRVAYQVLESFDHAGTDLAEFRRRRCPSGIAPEALILKGNMMEDIISSFKELKRSIPKRRLHRLVETLYFDRSDDLLKELREEIERTISKKDMDNMEACLGSGNALWLHLLELWDYIAPENQRIKSKENNNVSD